MNSAYWDTSCVLPLYVPEAASGELVECVASETGALASSYILRFEMVFALQAKVARGEIAGLAALKVHRQFLHDLTAGRFMLVPLGEDVALAADQLSAGLAKRNPSGLLRTLDGIHLATALHLGCKEIFTSDKRMQQLAEVVGLKVRPTSR